ncbi:MAG: fumarate hydratase [Nitrospirae bacterium RBG_19FT_COMBO_55_12]|nr:MAG: fumarate hydratase [Nitrospirae bacterium RBG_19FT_COMBO_55_12]
MTDPIKIQPPLTNEIIERLKSGDRVVITGVIYTARDMAHKYLVEGHKRGEPLPFDPRGQILYYTGPTPAPPGHAIGSAGPTTSYRMDRYTPFLLEQGLKAMIGKGPRGSEVKEAIKTHKAVYLAAIGGAGALISKTIKKAEVIAYPNLGTEAIMRLEVEDFPAIVVNDIYGGDLYRIDAAECDEQGNGEGDAC